MTVITLLTDFGLRDGYPGVMKGVIWQIAPEAHIADISHNIERQNILHGALVLSRTARYFPPGTIHVAVVDPGVGTARRPIGLRLGWHYFIGPDNGLFTVVLKQAELNHEPIKVVHLDRKEYWLPDVSNVFHGRDIFAPTAAYLATGITLEKLGTLIEDPIRLQLPSPKPTPDGGIRGQVMEIDAFGNLSTNITEADLLIMGDISIHVGGKYIEGLVKTYAEMPVGSLVALIDSTHSLAISVVHGSAADVLQAAIGDQIEVIRRK